MYLLLQSILLAFTNICASNLQRFVLIFLAMDVDEDDLDTTVDTPEATYLPPINRDAERLQDVYNLYSLLPKSVLNSLDENVLNDDILSIM